MRYRSIAQVYEFQGFSQSRCTSCVQEPLYNNFFVVFLVKNYFIWELSKQLPVLFAYHYKLTFLL